MNTDYAVTYRDLYRRHWWWRAREHAILKEIAGGLTASNVPRSILDVGCGDGLLFDALRPYGEVFGVEPDATTISPQSPWRDRIFQQPFDRQFQPGRSFDLILMLDVLEHLEDRAAALSQARSLLRDGGRLLITVPALQVLWTNHDDLNHHYRRYTKDSLRDDLRRTAWRIRQLRYLFHWTCPAKLAVRLSESLSPRPPAPPRVPHWLVNSLCYTACRFEQATISRVDMPFGSSLLAIASL